MKAGPIFSFVGIFRTGWVISSNHWFLDCSLDHCHKRPMDGKV